MTANIVVAGQLPGNKSCNKEQLETKTDAAGNQAIKFLTVQKMINEFLTRDRVVMKEVRCVKYSEWELAEKLNITPKALKSLKLPYVYKSMVSRITLPLVRLYCSTGWVDDECKIKK